ncbi:cotyledon-specific chloroplast biogenesis factor 1 [Klebsormidium nitens]|uniref:Cotyledon-specific chloroplast biogenesis factor 1 n=1 Tax=Klebsormidium nitens TaxID=105231 RepID=A0A0U9HI79_KLENI|nr:cotyledon-specific chloroplast biogenesis factor 1 [Klebsormidium nitens]|eukprot:GAQ79438.1 cotyledon-specific chloroplast biogenesis factor 1 [Klebsormidium nitens]
MKDIEPLPPEELEARLNCDVEMQACKKPLFSYTGECKRCQGTGVVSFYRKNGKEVISSCITCQGVGYVQRITAREHAITFEDLEKPDR